MNITKLLFHAISLSLISLVSAQSVSAQSDAPNIEEISVYGHDLSSVSSTGSRLDLSVMETPATLEIINGDSIRGRVDTSVLEAVTRSAGFTNEANPGNGGQSLAARGFRGQNAVTKLFDGTNYFTTAGTITFPFDTWGVERIEILKGPSSVIYGEGGIGGAINIIPKIPEQERSGQVRLSLGENNTRFIGLDLTGGLTDTVAYRLNYSNSRSDNWVDNSESSTEMLSVALKWDINEDLSLTARYDYGDQSPMDYFGVPVVNGEFVEQLLDKNFNVGDSELRYEDTAARLKADWTISDSLSLQVEAYHLETERYWKNSEFYSFDPQTGLVDRFDPLELGHDMDHNGLRANFVLDSSLGNAGLKTSFGFEFNDISFVRPSNFGPGNPNRVDFGADFDTVDSANFVPGSLSDLTSATATLDDLSDVDQSAIFAESQLKISDQLAIVGGLRYENIDTFYNRLGRALIDQSVDAVTGRLGLVFDVNDNTALYAQYATGATHPTGSVVNANASNRDSDLIKSEQIEVGIKQQVMDGRLQWNLALFDIVKNNLIEDDPDSSDPNDVITIPEQTSQGVEFGFSFEASPNLRMYGNTSLLNAETDTGDTPNYVPEATGNLGIAWSALSNLQVIADARYVGERAHPQIPIPSYTVIDASARWNFSEKLGITFRADNVFDELYASAAYYSSTWLVGKPRTFSITADYNF